MVAETSTTIRSECTVLDYANACELARQALATGRIRTILLDLGPARSATTGAYARLIQLRGVLLRAGRDLRISGLRDRALSLYEICRLGRLLPRVSPASN